MHRATFSEIFYPRFVNNIYLDTVAYDNYFDNVYGNAKRVKVRIRWYGELFGRITKPVLEFKVKNNELGGKISFPLDSFKIDKGFTARSIGDLFRRSEIPDAVKVYLLQLRGVLLNRYSRSYFLSVDKNFRLTIDSNLAFYELKPLRNNFLNRRIDRNNIVLELKYASNVDPEKVQSVTNLFPFRLTKSSKYVSGLTRLGKSE